MLEARRSVESVSGSAPGTFADVAIFAKSVLRERSEADVTATAIRFGSTNNGRMGTPLQKWPGGTTPTAGVRTSDGFLSHPKRTSQKRPPRSAARTNRAKKETGRGRASAGEELRLLAETQPQFESSVARSDAPTSPSASRSALHAPLPHAPHCESNSPRSAASTMQSALMSPGVSHTRATS